MRFECRGEIPDHPSFPLHPDALGIVHVEGVEGPCVLLLKGCANPRCTCGEAHVEVVEVTPEGGDRPGGLRLVAQVDVFTRAVAGPPALSRAQRALMAEVVALLPPDGFAAWAGIFSRRTDTAANLARAHIPPADVRTGVLQSWIHHASGGKDVFSGGGQQAAGRVEHSGHEWLFDVRFCPNPACDCRSFEIEGWCVADDEHDGCATLEQSFAVEGSLDGPDLEVAWKRRELRVDPLAVARAWLDGEVRGWFPTQVEEIRAIGARSLATEPTARRPAPVHASRVGRNDACPCGSGEKYKRCCGRG